MGVGMGVGMGVSMGMLALYAGLVLFGASSTGNSLRYSPPFQPQRSLPAIRIDKHGKVVSTQVVKQDLANELGCPLRDLRVVDPSFPNQYPTFMARTRAILICIENIKAVIRVNETLVFSPFQPEVQEFVPALQSQIEQAVEGVAYENIVLEAALGIVYSNLYRRVRALSPAVTSTLNGLRCEPRGLDIIQTQVDQLLPLKNKLDELNKKVKEIRRAMTDVLDNDEDMSMMALTQAAQLSAQKSSASSVDDDQEDEEPKRVDTTELEMLFENYLMQVEWISSEIEEVLDEITNTEENVELQLDLLRNRILRFELFLSIATFVIACGALVTGLFGMNLLSHFESNPYTFYIVSGVIVGGMFSLFMGAVRYSQNEKLF